MYCFYQSLPTFFSYLVVKLTGFGICIIYLVPTYQVPRYPLSTRLSNFVLVSKMASVEFQEKITLCNMVSAYYLLLSCRSLKVYYLPMISFVA